MSEKFYNPYHFVPVSARLAADSLPLTGFPARAGHTTHDRYVDDSLSGRLVCRLVCESPLVIGAGQTSRKGQPTVVTPFRLGGELAIPGSSLRGLISATAEAASNSALRVLESNWKRYEDALRRRGLHASDAGREFAAISPELLPLGKHKSKTTLTIAELLFGFVEDRSEELARERKDIPAAALASRLRFANGIAHPSPARLDAAVTLKELSSPKPPRATFYFQPKSGHGSISTKTPDAHAVPKGRKFYLPHAEDRRAEAARSDWGSAQQIVGPDASSKERSAVERKLRVTPIAAQSAFWFHIDFDNLSETELDLLCYAINPAPGYLHRLGLGKPLGLGLVRTTVAGVFLIDRRQRYLGDVGNQWPDESRYHYAWRESPAGWPARYEIEKKAANVAAAAEPAVRTAAFKRSAPPEHAAILQSLEMLGDRSLVRYPVHYPATAGSLERDQFRWFSQGPNQYLVPLPNSGTLPALDRNKSAVANPSASVGLRTVPLAPPTSADPRQLVGQTLMARAVELERIHQRDRIRFLLDVAGTTYPGFLGLDGAAQRKLWLNGGGKETMFKIRVASFDRGTFNLALVQ